MKALLLHKANLEAELKRTKVHCAGGHLHQIKLNNDLNNRRQRDSFMTVILLSNICVQSAANSLLRVELDACRQQLELEKNRSKALVHTQRGKHRGQRINYLSI